MFNKVDPKQSLPEMEEKMLRYWQVNNVFEKSILARNNCEKFVFFDGPPFANGLPHYGHILASALKDAVTRYWTMKGYYVPRVNGWDCHGLPVEYEVEKELGLSGRKDIVEYGVEKFNDKCRESVFKYTEEWKTLLKRIGRWVDFENGYATLQNDYMESIWWVFSEIWKKNLIYSGFKSMQICPRCETPLSNFEVSQGYKDVTDLSVTAKFKLSDEALKAIDSEEDLYVLAWTTTPWTLPGNVALAFGSDIEYRKVAVKNEAGEQEFYIVARDLADQIFGEGKYLVLDSVDPKKLEGHTYQPVFDYYLDQYLDEKKYVMVMADFVTTDSGTGIVHIAPMFGQDDYEVGEEYGLALIQHVKMDGTFKDEVSEFAGKFVKGQDGNIAQFLDKKGLLFSKENYRHSYPHCWRCDSPLLNYATRSLFVKVTDVQEKLIDNNKRIKWQPDHIQEGRFGKWLEGVRDWAISRNRFWGCPIPVWECECGKMTCISSVGELKELSGGKVPMRGDDLDLHKPYIDEILLPCSDCGKDMKRIPDVLDCWFESGSMPYAQLHYPFENKEDFELNFPADFIAEGLDQTRGWFYTLHVLSTILFNEPAFDNVIVNGILLAKDGEKLSKRKKNYPDPSELFDKKGVDSTRFFLYQSTTPLAEDVRFSEDHVDEIVKKFTLTLWNTYSFFVTYANIDDWKYDEKLNFVSENKLDKWLISELYSLVDEVTQNMDEYNLTKATRPMMEFVDNLSNWYIRRSRRRFWKSENDEDKNHAYQTLYIVLVELSKLIAPFMPFVADEIYQNLTAEESVHLANWPKVKDDLIDKDLNSEIRVIRLIVNLGHSVRAKAKVKVRQPLQTVKIALPKGIESTLIEAQKEVVLEELNVKNLEFVKEASEFVEIMVQPNARVLGPKYGSKVQEIIKAAKAGDFEVLDDSVIKILDYKLSGDEVEIGYKGKGGEYDVESEAGIVVALDTHITEELKLEGIARDIIRYVQDLRKEADFEVDNRINLWISASGQIEEAVVKFADYIKNETLADELVNKGDLEWDKEKEIDYNGEKVKIAISIR